VTALDSPALRGAARAFPGGGERGPSPTGVRAAPIGLGLNMFRQVTPVKVDSRVAAICVTAVQGHDLLTNGLAGQGD
jgi:hypothetical protein